MESNVRDDWPPVTHESVSHRVDGDDDSAVETGRATVGAEREPLHRESPMVVEPTDEQRSHPVGRTERFVAERTGGDHDDHV